MSKLEDIPKRDFFQVPEGYFDILPEKIQARIEATRPRPLFQPAIRYALAYALPFLIVALVIFYNTGSPPAAESMLASIETADLIQYIQESEITTDEMLDNVAFSADELDALENEIYEMNLEDADMETLDFEFNPL